VTTHCRNEGHVGSVERRANHVHAPSLGVEENDQRTVSVEDFHARAEPTVVEHVEARRDGAVGMGKEGVVAHAGGHRRTKPGLGGARFGPSPAGINELARRGGRRLARSHDDANDERPRREKPWREASRETVLYVRPSQRRAAPVQQPFSALGLDPSGGAEEISP